MYWVCLLLLFSPFTALWAGEAEDNLVLAEQFLSDIALADNVVEVEKGKVYYRQLAPGSGNKVVFSSRPTLLFSLRTLGKNGEVELHTTGAPLAVDLTEVIPGFAKGVVGMQEGEKRLIFVHPSLGYGKDSKKMPGNVLLIYTVEVVKPIHHRT